MFSSALLRTSKVREAGNYQERAVGLGADDYHLWYRLHKAGAQFFRGGAYKPRTSPYSFQGLGEEGLRIMAEVREQFGMRIVTEAIDNESLELVE